VILVSDGIETCVADPCAIARKLEETGVDFTAHVVGFDLKAEELRQIACIAQETGGRFLPAQDAASLGDALSLAISEVQAAPPVASPEPEPEPPTREATLNAPPSVPAGSEFEVAWEVDEEMRGDY